MSNFKIRPLKESDYYHGFLELLEQLTSVGADEISYELFVKQMKSINSHVVVIQNDNNGDGRIIGTAAILIEKKFIHKLSSVGHIEDVVVDQEYRGNGLGKILVDYCIAYAKNNDCYKVILNCSEDNVPFYSKCGFTCKNLEMSLYF